MRGSALPLYSGPFLQFSPDTSLISHLHSPRASFHVFLPFQANGGDGGVKSIVNKQYNTPVGIYSDESIAETLSAQAEVLAGGVLG